jgi:aldehyde:ferredoxin oxidoreductase
MMTWGERYYVLQKDPSSEEGFTREHDYLPRRFFEPLKGGPLNGEAIDERRLEEEITSITVCGDLINKIRQTRS